MKRSTCLSILAAAIFTMSLATVPTASPSPATAGVTTQPAPFNATITAASSVFLGCCYTFVLLHSTEAVIPRVGRTTVSGQIDSCGSSIFSPCPDRAGTTLSLVFTTPSGDTLTLGGYNPTAPLTWSVVAGTGRFAGASGSGHYTYHTTVNADGWVTTIALSGTFRMRR